MAICSKVSCDFVEKLFEQKRGGLFQFRKNDDQAVSSYYDEVINIDGEDKNIDYLEFVVEETPEKSVQIFNQIPILFQSNRGLNIDNQIKKLKEIMPKECYVYDYSYDKTNINYPANISIICESKKYLLSPDLVYESQMYNLYPTMKKEVYQNALKVKDLLKSEKMFRL